MTHVEDITQQIKKGEYDDKAPEALEAVVDGVLADKLETFEEWWKINKMAGLYATLAAGDIPKDTFVKLLHGLARAAWVAGEFRQICLDDAAELERLNA